MKFFVHNICFLGVLVACGSPGVRNLSCEQTNWYELGRQKGRQGLSLNPTEKALHSSCGWNDLLLQQKAETLLTGFNAGLTDFCTPTGAFNLGRLGQGLNFHVCPDHLQEAFQEAHQQGQNYAQLERKTLLSESRLQKIDLELATSDLSLAKRALREGEKIEILKNKEIQLEALRSMDATFSSEPNERIRY